MFTTSGTYPWPFVTQIFYNGQPSPGDDRKTVISFSPKLITFNSLFCINII